MVEAALPKPRKGKVENGRILKSRNSILMLKYNKPRIRIIIIKKVNLSQNEALRQIIVAQK